MERRHPDISIWEAYAVYAQSQGASSTTNRQSTHGVGQVNLLSFQAMFLFLLRVLTGTKCGSLKEK